MARSTFYYYLKKITEPDKNLSTKAEIVRIYRQNKGRYGYRRITTTLKCSGMIINHKRVSRLMQECGLKSLVRVKKYKSYKGTEGKIAPNLLQRDFKATRPCQKWVTDVTEFAIEGKKLYLSPILDLYNGEIVSYSIAERPCFKQITDMLQKAFCILPAKVNLILHSDQGWQYQAQKYQELLKQRNIQQSMSRKGNCLDNAVMESFFATLKSELYYIEQFTSYEALKQAIIEYIEYYNNYRIKQKLNGLSPVQYRTQAA